MQKILITGGAGFIGSSLADRLLANPENKLVLVDNLLTGSADLVPVHPNCDFVKCDVNNYNDISAIMTAYSFDYVFHYAAVVGVQRTLQHPVMVLQDLDGIRNILSLCKNTGVKRVYFSSSSEVYGEPVQMPQNEEMTPLNSRLPYAVVKNAGEAYCRSYNKEFDLDFTVLRFFNTYGPKQSADFVMSRFIDQALSGDDVTVYGDGQQSRTFCYIDDNLDFVETLLNQDLYLNQIVNVGSDKIISVLELAEKVIEMTGSKSRIRFLPALEEGDMTRRQPDISKMKEVLKRDMQPIESCMDKVIAARRGLLESC